MWKINEENITKALAYSVKYNISFYTLLILLNRNVDIKDIDIYLKYNIIDYIEKYDLEKNIPEITKAATRIKEACEKKQRIFIYGDYDVDGASSTALLINFFDQFNIKSEFHIPNRFDEGYGLTKYGIQKAVDTFNPDLMIVVDCGSSSHEEIAFATNLGVEVIVLDHHIYNTRPKTALAVVNPNFEFLKSHYDNMCASGVTFITLLKTIMLGRVGFKKYLWNKVTIMNQVEIATIGTICDCMTLKGINHILTKKGIQKLNNGDTTSNIKKLLNDKDKVLIKDISFLIGPRLNAGGRLGKENLATLSLLHSSQDQEIVNKLVMLNETRKEIEEATSKKMHANLQIFTYFTISIGSDWHEGVIGILASRLKEEYKKPAFVLSLKEDHYIGSARSIKPIHLGEIISLGKSANIIASGGGHELAGGISVHKDKIYEFINFLEQHITQKPKLDQCYDCEINFPTEEILQNILALEPYGNGFEEPKFLIKNVSIKTLRVINDKHISIMVRKENLFCKSIIFNRTKYLNKDKTDIICNIRKNYYTSKIDIYILDIIS